VVVPDDCFLLAALESGHRLSQLVERHCSHARLLPLLDHCNTPAMMKWVEFTLVPEESAATISNEGLDQIRFLLLEFQPARRVEFIGDPVRAISVSAAGPGVEIAPGVLVALERAAGTRLIISTRD
jgi:hypothetical protein